MHEAVNEGVPGQLHGFRRLIPPKAYLTLLHPHCFCQKVKSPLFLRSLVLLNINETNSHKICTIFKSLLGLAALYIRVYLDEWEQ